MRITSTSSIVALAIAAFGTSIALAQAMPPRPDRTASVTRADAQSRAETMFARMDANHDGRLTPEDRAAGEAAHHAAMFAMIDADHNGSISRAEWDAHHAAMAAHHGDGGPDGDQGDHMGPPPGGPDGDHMGPPPGGDDEQMRHGGRGGGARGGHGGRGGDMMMRRADTNHDNAIDRAEFVAAAMQRFDRADANHDGTLTAAEREAAHGAMRGAMGRRGSMGPVGDGAAMPPPPPPPAF